MGANSTMAASLRADYSDIDPLLRREHDLFILYHGWVPLNLGWSAGLIWVGQLNAFQPKETELWSVAGRVLRAAEAGAEEARVLPLGATLGAS